MKEKKGITLQDVAREAGVSAMTVSAVLHGTRSGTRVSESTRVRVEEIAAKLRYRRNAVAHGLTRRRMDTIGVVAIVEGADVNLYFLETLNGILEEAAHRGQNTVVFSVTDWQKDERRMLQFCDGRIDGLILIAPDISSSFAAELAQHIPYLSLHSAQPIGTVQNLDVDNTEGAALAVRYLIAQGHRRIAHFSGSLAQQGARERLQGYRNALAEAQIPEDASLIRLGSFTVAAGRELMAELLAFPDPLPTAIFCANDAIAFGAMEVLADHQLRVPEAISLIGFDDLLLARMTSPHLTTIRQPFQEMGRKAVTLLLDQAQRREVSETASRCPLMPVELVIRHTVTPPKNKLLL